MEPVREREWVYPGERRSSGRPSGEEGERVVVVVVVRLVEGWCKTASSRSLAGVASVGPLRWDREAVVAWGVVVGEVGVGVVVVAAVEQQHRTLQSS